MVVDTVGRMGAHGGAWGRIEAFSCAKAAAWLRCERMSKQPILHRPSCSWYALLDRCWSVLVEYPTYAEYVP